MNAVGMALHDGIGDFGGEEASGRFDGLTKMELPPGGFQFCGRTVEFFVVQSGVEPGEALLPFSRMEHIVEHPAEVLLRPGNARGGLPLLWFDPVEIRRELATTKRWTKVAFATARTPLEFVFVFLEIVAGLAGQMCQTTFSRDEVGDIGKRQHVSLGGVCSPASCVERCEAGWGITARFECLLSHLKSIAYSLPG